MYTCAYCGKDREAKELRTINSVFEAPEGTSADTLTVCAFTCEELILQNSTVVYSNEPFQEPA